MPIKKKTKQKRTTRPKGNPAQIPWKMKRADNVYRRQAKPTTSDLTERFDARPPVRVEQTSGWPSRDQRGSRPQTGSR